MTLSPAASNLTQSQLRSPRKLSCLILVMAIALYWAVGAGLWAVKNPVYKKTAKNLLYTPLTPKPSGFGVRGV